MGLFSVFTFFVTSALDRSVNMILINYISIWIHLSCQFYIYICQYSFSFVWYLYLILWTWILWTELCLVIDQDLDFGWYLNYKRFWLHFCRYRYRNRSTPYRYQWSMLTCYVGTFSCVLMFLHFVGIVFHLSLASARLKKCLVFAKVLLVICVCVCVCVRVCVFLRMYLLHNGSW